MVVPNAKPRLDRGFTCAYFLTLRRSCWHRRRYGNT
uniref:Uncharacterized protein n=1 Tax=Podoviridae sp. ct9P15 TaxID=2826543 RepID=A0A8S5MFI1_9CAUD|nr:MAG TPA: hypothetical protein [Podoviridae sp. ct9P15]